MAFEKQVPAWNAPGIEPPESLKNSGFTAGYKPPAEYFNWFMHAISNAATELQGRVDDCAPAPYAVILSGNKDDGYEIDKTFEEIVAAYNQGRVVLLFEYVAGPTIMQYHLQVAVYDQVVFANSERMYHKTVNIYRNGLVTRVDQTVYTDKYPPHYSVIGAEPVGAVSDHNDDETAHAGILAPAGFGLGERAQIIDNLDNAIKNGFYASNLGTPSAVIGGSAYWACLVIAYNTNYILQIAYRASHNPASITVRRKNGDSGWGFWEYLNPPMAADVEYRTTERYNNNVLYRKRIVVEHDLSNEMGEWVEVQIPHGIENIGAIARITAMCSEGVVPRYWSDATLVAVSSIDQTNITICTNRTVWDNMMFSIDIAYTKGANA